VARNGSDVRFREANDWLDRGLSDVYNACQLTVSGNSVSTAFIKASATYVAGDHPLARADAILRRALGGKIEARSPRCCALNRTGKLGERLC
jgi:hypothetical protein